MNMNETVKSAMETALEALNRELEKDPLSPERIMAISKAIEVLSGIKTLQLMAARERQPKQWINESGVYAGSITSKHPYGDSLNGETQPQNILAECGSEM